MYESALNACADLVLHHSDQHMASIINKVSMDDDVKNIFVVCGYG